ncbi:MULTISPECIES: EXLDI protein [unclassified Luteococcus]|uniref:EXLDI protein n=1 Tax=unclassified Luteococcus TaxID=2639923 RepID=UPI00313F08A1
MGRRNIYVADSREAFYDRAAAMAGSLSAAIDLGLDLYVARRQQGSSQHKEIQVYVGRDEERVLKRFHGQELAEFLIPNRTPGRHDGVTVYHTARSRLACWRWSDPDWQALRKRSSLPQMELHETWSERTGEELLVFDSVAEVVAAFDLREEDRTLLENLFTPLRVEVLDI